MARDTKLLSKHLNLEAYVYTTVRGGTTRRLIGKVSICGTSVVPHSDAVVLQYPLKKGRIFSRVRGEIWLKVYISNDPSFSTTNSSTLLPSVYNSGNLIDAEVNLIHNKQQYDDLSSISEASLQSAEWEIEEMRVEAMEVDAPPPKTFKLGSTPSAQPPKRANTHDLVERMDFLYVNVVKAHDLPIMVITERPYLFVEVRVGKFKGVTKHIDKSQDPEWNVVFAFSKDGLQDSLLDVEVKNKNPVQDYSVGIVTFDLNKVSMRVTPDSPLAPQWYPLNKGERIEGELMLAVWTGTQADEAFYDSWHIDDAIPIIDLSAATCTQFRPKIYHAPTLCYARVTVIEAQELEPTEKTRFPEVYVKAQMGGQMERTKTLKTRTLCPNWNEDLFFVVAEPFEGHVVLTVENQVSSGQDEILGIVTIPLGSFDTRADDQAPPSRWYNLEKPFTTYLLKKENFCSRLHLRLCLEGGYHVLDESTDYSSDLRPTAKGLCKASIGVLELGICKAEQLHPMKTRDGKETSDTYCVAKYGKEWVRTRTIIDSLSPKYNEQYSWEVYDRTTVVTLGVFDNNQFGAKGPTGNEDLRIGKVEIRISALEPGRVYTYFCPLLDLRPTGVKTMGQLHLAIRFSCTSFLNMIYQYFCPLLPKMHYVQHIPKQETMRHKAVSIVAMQLGRVQPTLGKEVVEYMSEVRTDLWSMRRGKVNAFRLMAVIATIVEMCKWFGGVCSWKNPIATVAVHILFLGLVCFPRMILPMLFLYMFLIVVRKFCNRPSRPSHKDLVISRAHMCPPHELDEEFDTFPTSRSPELLRMKYDRLRTVAGRLQNMFGDLATHGERLCAAVNWRDPFATAMFGIFCLVAALVFYVIPKQVMVASVLYTMRHPRFRSGLPALPLNFIRRLPDYTETIL